MDLLFQVEPSEDFTKKAEEVLKFLFIEEQENTCPITKQAQKELKEVISNNNFDMNKVIEEIQRRNFDIEKTNYFINSLNEKRKQLLYAALLDHNNSFGECATEFSWAIKLIMGTSELKELTYPLLQLVVKTINSKGIPKRNIYEMNRDVLAKIISLLETIE